MCPETFYLLYINRTSLVCPVQSRYQIELTHFCWLCQNYNRSWFNLNQLAKRKKCVPNNLGGGGVGGIHHGNYLRLDGSFCCLFLLSTEIVLNVGFMKRSSYYSILSLVSLLFVAPWVLVLIKELIPVSPADTV